MIVLHYYCTMCVQKKKILIFISFLDSQPPDCMCDCYRFILPLPHTHCSFLVLLGNAIYAEQFVVLLICMDHLCNNHSSHKEYPSKNNGVIFIFTDRESLIYSSAISLISILFLLLPSWTLFPGFNTILIVLLLSPIFHCRIIICHCLQHSLNSTRTELYRKEIFSKGL